MISAVQKSSKDLAAVAESCHKYAGVATFVAVDNIQKNQELLVQSVSEGRAGMQILLRDYIAASECMNISFAIE